MWFEAESYKFNYKPPTFKVGDEIFLVRLYADQDLNGQNGVVVEDLEDGTFRIELHKTKELLKVRSQNLAHVEDKVYIVNFQISTNLKNLKLPRLTTPHPYSAITATLGHLA